MVPSIKNYFFHQSTIDFVSKLYLSDQKHQTDVNVRGGNYNGKLVFTMKDFVTLGIDCQSIYFMSNIFFKNSINGVCVPQFQLAYVCATTHPSHKILFELCL